MPMLNASMKLPQFIAQYMQKAGLMLSEAAQASLEDHYERPAYQVLPPHLEVDSQFNPVAIKYPIVAARHPLAPQALPSAAADLTARPEASPLLRFADGMPIYVQEPPERPGDLIAMAPWLGAAVVMTLLSASILLKACSVGRHYWWRPPVGEEICESPHPPLSELTDGALGDSDSDHDASPSASKSCGGVAAMTWEEIGQLADELQPRSATPASTSSWDPAAEAAATPEPPRSASPAAAPKSSSEPSSSMTSGSSSTTSGSSSATSGSADSTDDSASSAPSSSGPSEAGTPSRLDDDRDGYVMPPKLVIRRPY